MPDFKFANYPGVGTTNSDAYSYSQAVKVGSIVKCSGQGGWDSEGKMVGDVAAQIPQAFENVEAALKAVDPNASWKNVYAVKSYHLDIDGAFELMVEHFKQWMPDHRPVWTCVQIGKLGLEGMEVEIEVEAQV